MITIGQHIKGLRKEKGITQGELAKEIKLSQASLSQIENDIKRPHPSSLDRILKAFKISLPTFYLLMLTEEDIVESKRELFNTLYPTFKKIITNN